VYGNCDVAIAINNQWYNDTQWAGNLLASHCTVQVTVYKSNYYYHI
jgi:hypothetical protein